MIVFGVDVARTGEDKSVVAVREDFAIIHIEEWGQVDTMESVGRIEQLIRRYKPENIIVDLIGIGAGVFDRLRELNYPVLPFNASARCERMDSTGELGFVNMRAYAWWHMRELLQPYAADPILLPDDTELIRELTAPKFKHVSGGKIQIESKDDIRKRIGRSPDKADAVVMAFVDLDPSLFEEAYNVYTREQVEAMVKAAVAETKPPEPTYEEMLEEWRKQQEESMWKDAVPLIDVTLFEMV